MSTDLTIEFPLTTDPPAMLKTEVALRVSSVDPCGGVMAFSLRTGGYSPAPLDSLNFSQAQGDSAGNVKRNVEKLGEHLAIDPSRIATCRQVHGSAIAIVDSVADRPPEADAVITDRPGLFPAVKTADCLPVLLLDPVKGVAAAVHAGWRGTVLRITREVLELMEIDFHCDPGDITAALGPAINTCCYEVDDAVLVPFRRAVPDGDRFITVREYDAVEGEPSRQSFRLDLAAANRFELIAHGVPEANIVTAGLCTSCRPELFFSHRRDGAMSGRHIAITGFRA
jgi:YfiH family protein